MNSKMSPGSSELLGRGRGSDCPRRLSLGGQIAARHRLFLPAAAQSPIELNETLILGAARLRKRELRRKQGALVVQDFEISRGSPSIAHVRKTNRLLQIRYGVLL